MTSIKHTAKQLVAPGKGILAADESNPSANKRLAPLDIEQTEEMRRQYRQLLLSAPGIETDVSGVILYDETIRQATDEGKSFVGVLEGRGIIPGIKVDMGLKDLPNFPGEKVSQGLDDLDKRLAEYYEIGARFTKWRSVITIGKDIPTDTAISANAHVLARYAAIVQEAGMVPMVEPEVMFDGTHSLEQCQQVLKHTLHALFTDLRRFRVDLSGVILKTSMALPGKDSGEPIDHKLVSEATASTLRDCVPADVPGVVFLSGGQTPHDAFENLNQITKLGPYPWEVTFSYSRALQDPVLKHWKGVKNNVKGAQELFKAQTVKAAAARSGNYTPGDEGDQSVSKSQDS